MLIHVLVGILVGIVRIRKACAKAVSVGRGGGEAPPPPPNNPPTFSIQCLCETVKTRSQCTNLIYVPFILFEGISKSILFRRSRIISFVGSLTKSMETIVHHGLSKF